VQRLNERERLAIRSRGQVRRSASASDAQADTRCSQLSRIRSTALAWWMGIFPGLALMLTVLAINLLGDWLRDYLDPTLRNV
jgi:hypothetical protein